AGELPSGCESIGGDMGFESANCVSSISAEGMGRGCGAPEKDGSPRRDCVSDQAGDSTGSDLRGGGRRCRTRCGSRRRGLWHPHRIARGSHRTPLAVYRGGAKFDDGVGARETAVAGQATRNNGTASTAIAALLRSPTCLCEAVGEEPALHCFQAHHL